MKKLNNSIKKNLNAGRGFKGSPFSKAGTYFGISAIGQSIGSLISNAADIVCNDIMAAKGYNNNNLRWNGPSLKVTPNSTYSSMFF